MTDWYLTMDKYLAIKIWFNRDRKNEVVEIFPKCILISFNSDLMKAVRGQKKPRRPKKHEEVDLLKKGFSKVAQQVA